MHAKISLGCQDAVWVARNGDTLVAVIADGCSTHTRGLSHNQVGAVLGSQFVATTALQKLSRADDISDASLAALLRHLRRRTVVFLKRLCATMGCDRGNDPVGWNEFVEDKLLFTVLTVLVHRGRYVIFGHGDGCFGIDGRVSPELEGPHGYIGAAVLVPPQGDGDRFAVYASGSISDVKHIWIGSDGVLQTLVNESDRDSFQRFLCDPLTCTRNNQMEDTTVQAFRRNLLGAQRRILGDDVAVVVVQTEAPDARAEFVGRNGNAS